MKLSRLVGVCGTRRLDNENPEREEIPNMSFLRDDATGGHETVV
jgi:hypothetical protein